jgi:hypothetical protein
MKLDSDPKKSLQLSKHMYCSSRRLSDETKLSKVQNCGQNSEHLCLLLSTKNLKSIVKYILYNVHIRYIAESVLFIYDPMRILNMQKNSIHQLLTYNYGATRSCGETN